ncbi:FtsH protease activity modulator HflK [Shewanella gelidii]|uniref:Protein HflK n=1 Tax=Shewanella gelidii TaxID=1642821 RepID=A0A917JPB5_9GAMM|nr:FtsH protease activity modulator HflK [Shewanella gelidii]MCL1097747.1 FtsH protease activity modulator HflK [Shewanella gelidii]GGI79126.1 protease modulator HflK [Shewanella gelidii]
MAWNEPGNKGNDPWGNKGGNGNDKGPPDLDEVFRNLAKRFGGGKGKGPSGNAFGSISLLIALGIALTVWAASGFYTVKEAERGVALRFGEYIGEVDPGLHWRPTFIDAVFPVDVQTVRSIPAAGSMLTADENVVKVELDVQYRVTNPYAFIFSAVDANESLREATDSALRYVVGHNTMDDILTTGRDKIRTDTWEEIERILEPYNLGLSVVDVNFLPARPPEEVKAAFDDAIAAQEDEQRFIREAEAYAREIEPKARGTVQRMSQQASAYKQREILEAEGKVARFEKLLPEYKMAPEVTRKRLYIDTMQQVLSSSNKVLIDAKNSGNMMYLPIDKLMENKRPATNTSATTTQSQPQINSTNTVSQNSMQFDGRQSRAQRSRQGRE